MADLQADSILKSNGVGSWKALEVPKDNAVYQFLQDVKNTTDPVFQTLNLFFTLVNEVLDFVSSLLIDVTQPIKLLIDAIIAILDSFINDLKGLGFYLTFDNDFYKTWDASLKTLSSSLAGGYQAFEARTVSKLLNAKDKTRPDFSNNSKVFALTFFAGADVSGINTIMKNLSNLLALFGVSSPTKLLPPTNVKAAYYKSFGPFRSEMKPSDIEDDHKPEGIRIEWDYPDRGAITPSRFLVHVSTSSKEEVIQFSTTQASTQELFRGTLLDPANPRLEADAVLTDLIAAASGVNDENGFYIETRDTPVTRTTVLSEVQTRYRNYVLNPTTPGSHYKLDIPFEKLPPDGGDKYRVSVRSCTEDTLEASEDGKITKSILTYAPSAARTIPLTPSALSVISNEATIPKLDSDIRLRYLSALKEALAVYYLCRLDSEAGRNFLGVSVPPAVSGKLPPFPTLGQTPGTNTQILTELIDKLVVEFIPVCPPEGVISALRVKIDKLNNTDKDHLPLYRFMKGCLLGEGVGRGIYLSRPTSQAEQQAEAAVNGETANSNPVPTQTSTPEQAAGAVASAVPTPVQEQVKVTEIRGLPRSPVILSVEGSLRGFISSAPEEQYYNRNAAHIPGMKELAGDAISVLSLMVGDDAEGAWLNLKLSDFVGLGVVIDLLDDVKDYVQSLSNGLNGIITVIKNAIALMKDKIAELQRVIAKIKAIIDAILGFRLPAGFYVLPTVSNGTTGCVSDIMASTSKPAIGPESYGLGAMVVFGGLPSLLVDFFIALIGDEP